MATLSEKLATAERRLSEHYVAETDALKAQELSLTSASGLDRRQVMSNLADIRRGIADLKREIASLEAAIAKAPRVGGAAFSSASFN